MSNETRKTYGRYVKKGDDNGKKWKRAAQRLSE